MTRTWNPVRDPGGRIVGYATDGATVDKDPWGNRTWVATVDGEGRWETRTLAEAKARAEAVLARSPAGYVTVMDAHPRSGWIAAHREGDLIVHTRLMAGKYDAKAARAEAEAMFPDRRVYLSGDPNPPWKEPAA